MPARTPPLYSRLQKPASPPITRQNFLHLTEAAERQTVALKQFISLSIAALIFRRPNSTTVAPRAVQTSLWPFMQYP